MLRRPAPQAAALGLALALSLLALGRYGWSVRGAGLLPLLLALALVVVLDAWSRLIPDVITLPGLAYALVLAATLGSPSLLEAALGALAGGGVLLVAAVVSRGGIGGGDVKLMAMLGAALGWKPALVVLALSQVAGLLVVLGRLIARRRWVWDPVPVGALIALLGALALVIGP